MRWGLDRMHQLARQCVPVRCGQLLLWRHLCGSRWCLLQKHRPQLCVWAKQQMLWQLLPGTWQQMLPHQGAGLSSDQGHQMRGLELRICGLPEPLWVRVPVWRKEFMLWRHLCWGRQHMLPECRRNRFRLCTRFALRQECMPGPSMMLNSSAPSWPDSAKAVAFFGASRHHLHGRSQQVTCTCSGTCQK